MPDRPACHTPTLPEPRTPWIDRGQACGAVLTDRYDYSAAWGCEGCARLERAREIFGAKEIAE